MKKLFKKKSYKYLISYTFTVEDDGRINNGYGRDVITLDKPIETEDDIIQIENNLFDIVEIDNLMSIVLSSFSLIKKG